MSEWLESTDRVAAGIVYDLWARGPTSASVLGALSAARTLAQICGTFQPQESGGLWYGRVKMMPRASWLAQDGGRVGALRAVYAPHGATYRIKVADEAVSWYAGGVAALCQVSGMTRDVFQGGLDATGVAADIVRESSPKLVRAVQDTAEGAVDAASGLGATLKSVGAGLGALGEAQRIAPTLFGIALLAGIGWLAVAHGPAILRSVR